MRIHTTDHPSCHPFVLGPLFFVIPFVLFVLFEIVGFADMMIVGIIIIIIVCIIKRLHFIE